MASVEEREEIEHIPEVITERGHVETFSGIRHLLLGLAMGMAVVVSFAAAIGTLSSGFANADGAAVFAAYNDVLHDAMQVQDALLTKNTARYFSETRRLKKSSKALQDLVPSERLDVRPITALGWGPASTQLWWFWGSSTNTTTNTSATNTSFISRVEDFFKHKGAEVSQEIHTAISDDEEAAHEAYSAVNSTAAFVATHTASEDYTAAKAFVENHLQWAKNKLCVMAGEQVFSTAVSTGLTVAGSAALCDSSVCPEIVLEVDALGAGPADSVADVLAGIVGAGCAVACTSVLEDAVESALNEGLVLAGHTSFAHMSDALCSKLGCGPVNQTMH